jgi:calcineurin-like phosphoesterase family protein
MATFFTADHHFGHPAILRYTKRPWQTTDEMNRALVTAWNAVVSPSDTVYHLGDFAFLRASDAADMLSRLHGRIHLIRGNHDRKMKTVVREKFVSTHDLLELTVGKTLFVLCHYPMLSWRASHYGSVHLHGHSHGGSKLRHPRRIDVGVDCHPEYKPFAYGEIMRMVEAAAAVVTEVTEMTEDE